MLWRDADPRVSDLDHDSLLRAGRDVDAHRAAFRRELDSVGHEIRNNLQQQSLVAKGKDFALAAEEDEVDLSHFGAAAAHPDAGFQSPGDVELVFVEL